MATSDIVAIGILIGFVIVGMKGYLRWLSGAVVGLALGVLVLAAVGFANNRAWLGETGDFVREGQIAPALGWQVDHVAEQAGVRLPAHPIDRMEPDR